MVVIVNDPAKTFRAFFQLFAGMPKILTYSYGGQRILDTASSVCKNCYTLDKDYLAIMMRTNQEVKIKTFAYDATLETFTFIINQTMSFFTLLRSFM